MKKILTILLSALMVVSFASAATKTTATTTKTTTQSKNTSSVLVATVNIYNATNTMKDLNNYLVSFQLYNRVGIQSGIRYGIELVDASTSKIIDTQLANESVTLGEKESKDIKMNYSIPNFITSGNYKMVIVAENQNGLPLAYVSAGYPERIINIANNYIAPSIDNCFLTVENDSSTTAKYTNIQGVDILPTEVLKATCKLSNTGNSNLTNLKISLITHKKDLFGDILSRDIAGQDITLKAGSSQDVSFNISVIKTPQSYYIDASLINSSQAKISESLKIHYIVHGPSATIQNTVLDKTDYKKNDTANLQVFWTPSVDNFTGSRLGGTKDSYTIKAIISDASSTNCGSISQTITNNPNSIGTNNLKIKINKDCIKASVAVSITDKNGNVLDTANIDPNKPTNVVDINPNISTASTINNVNKIYVFIFLIVLVLIGYGIIEMKKQHEK
ncbi:MAG: hypothetical protein WCO35_03530 [Candidatus Nomurabacteria bacterium]